MDERHRQYCIRLGNPYMMEERYQEQFKTVEESSSWIPEEKLQNNNWIKSSKKFTN